ncbi:MAG: Uma2 family endonuclease [Verrucomicrobiae bacterium]|nr:Uma2 family endonuclease [Verrucomicrobiae bacterium]MCP5541376.1 Uma2 family endonuclease [Akkermansiaceae bacterium]
MVSGMIIELPPRAEQDAFNRKRWEELCRDTKLDWVEERIETDRHGNIVMSPMPAARHGRFQSEIVYLLKTLLPGGVVHTECPISTSDGVKGADVVWISRERFEPMKDDLCFSRAPEICVEVISPSNSPRAISEKGALYFDAGATEFWTCGFSGKMRFFLNPGAEAEAKSALCPEFPTKIELS